jgi:LPS sulfotransferase NodH
MAPVLSYLVCATPRSGSTLLCKVLDQTGVAGHPEEYFEALRHSGLPRRPHEYFDPQRHVNIVERLAFREMPDDTIPAPRLTVQADEVSEEWVARVRRDLAVLVAADPVSD